jgi:prepilin-type N-terminal cleavage/methylation domain-containing protein
MRRRQGLTLIETVIALGISAVVVSAMYTVLRTAVSGDRALRVRVDLQLDAVRMLRDITEILKNSGPLDQNTAGLFDAGDYPYIWTDGTTNGAPHGGFYAYLDGTNPGIVQKATAAHEGLGPSQEIAFRLPRDVDGDGRSSRPGYSAVTWSGSRSRPRRASPSRSCLPSSRWGPTSSGSRPGSAGSKTRRSISSDRPAR